MQRRAAWILLLVVLAIVGYGGWRWTVRRSVERAAEVFLAAMIAGDSETLLENMTGPALESYLAKSPAEQDDFASPIPGAISEIREVHLQGSSARVRVLWKVSGFDIWSDLELEKPAMGPWKVSNIRQPRMIPTWEQVRRHIEESGGASAPVHRRLGEKFEDRKDVEVRPLEEGELDP